MLRFFRPILSTKLLYTAPFLFEQKMNTGILRSYKLFGKYYKEKHVRRIRENQIYEELTLSVQK